MKKLLIAVLATLCLTGCSARSESKVEPEMYIASGHYYTRGEVILDDGNIWDYSQDIISDAPSYDNEPVYVLMYDAETPDYIYDDEIVGLTGR